MSGEGVAAVTAPAPVPSLARRAGPWRRRRCWWCRVSI